MEACRQMRRPTAGYYLLADSRLVDAFTSMTAHRGVLSSPVGVPSCSKGRVPEQSIMSLNIVGLCITVVGNRLVEPPGGHSYANHLGKAVARDLGRAHNISVAPIFTSGAGRPIQMSYCGRGECRDVWEGQDEQLGGRAFLKV